MNIEQFNSGLLSYLKQSPTPYHAVASARRLLDDAGFVALSERDDWQLTPGQAYYTTRHDSSLLAFVYGHDNLLDSGIRMLGAHTDSPCLKVKPRPERIVQGYLQLGVEVYGGALLNPWFDRDLSLAGRISFRTAKGGLEHQLIDFERPIAVVPSLAIHLDREANDKRSINPQEDMQVILTQVDSGATGSSAAPSLRELIKQHLLEQNLIDAEAEILEYDLSFYDVQAPGLLGLNQDFIASARLDNLLSCYLGLQAMVNAGREVSSLLVLNDHEEVGSVSDVGAQGTLLTSFLERLVPDNQQRQRVINTSVMFSVDNAHGVHPNFARKHDDSHGPLLNSGPVLKVNANQRYATTSDTASFARLLAEDAGIPLQVFVSRADMACGSTIGPMTAAKLGIKTLDIGVPTFAMHSIRELAGARDAYQLWRLAQSFCASRILV